MNSHLIKRNNRYHVNKNKESFSTTLKGLAVIELCVSEMCTRSCTFCPRSDKAVYKNQQLFMSLDTIDNIAKKSIVEKYEGDFHISGFGEPMLHPNIMKIIAALNDALDNHIALTTNGDLLDTESIKDLYTNGIDYVIVSCYDGPDQLKKLYNMFSCAGITPSQYELRELWLKNDEDATGFAVRNQFNNRSGTATSLKLAAKQGQCFLPFYKLVLDWNGSALLCCNDWHRKHKGFGNINEVSLSDIWYSMSFNLIRKELHQGKRTAAACSNCSIDGTLIGKDSMDLLI